MNSWLITITSSFLILANQDNNVGEEKYTFEQADSFFKNKNWEVALEAYNSLVNDNPYKGEYRYRLGEIYYYLNKYDQSTEAYKMSLELGYSPQKVIYNIGRNLAIQGNAEDAVKWLEKALTDGKYETSYGREIRQKLETDSALDKIRSYHGFIPLLPPKPDDNMVVPNM